MQLQRFFLMCLMLNTLTCPMGWVVGEDGILGKNGIEALDKSALGPNGIHKTLDTTNQVIDKNAQAFNQTANKGIEAANHTVSTIDKRMQELNQTINNSVFGPDGIKTISDELSKANTEVAKSNQTLSFFTQSFNNFLSKFSQPDRFAKTFGFGVLGCAKALAGIELIKIGIQKYIENTADESKTDTQTETLLTSEQKKGLILCACGFAFMSIGSYVMLKPGILV